MAITRFGRTRNQNVSEGEACDVDLGGVEGQPVENPRPLHASLATNGPKSNMQREVKWRHY